MGHTRKLPVYIALTLSILISRRNYEFLELPIVLTVSLFSLSFLFKRQHSKFECCSSQPLLVANTSHRLPQPPETSTSQNMKIAYIFASPGLLNSDVSTESTLYFQGSRNFRRILPGALDLEHAGGTFLLNVRNQYLATQRNTQCCRNFRTRKTAQNGVTNLVQFVMNKGSPRPARNIRSDSEIFAANFVVDWNVHGVKWQSPHWREKIAQASAKLQRFIHCRCLHGFLWLSPI